MVNRTTEPTAEQCEALMKELGLSYTQGSVGIGADCLYVYIWREQKRPALVKWMGWPIVYRIGGGVPRALGVQSI